MLHLFCLRVMFATAVIFSAQLVAPQALAQQPVDSGDFQDGAGGAPSNQDSEAVPGLSMGTPSYAGTGCPQGTLAATLSPDQTALSILFDQYVVRVSGAPKAQARMNCQIQIPFQVPAGYRVAIVKMDYRGFTSVPAGARSTFGAGFSYLEFNGVPTKEKRVVRAKVFSGPRSENFELSSQIAGPPFSPCGKNFVLQAESILNAQSNAAGEEVVTAVDSLDTATQPVVYSLRWRRCDGSSPSVPGPLPPGVHPPARPIPCPPNRPRCR